MLDSERFLSEKGIPYRLIDLTDRAMTVADVIRFSKGDFSVDEVCKTVIMRDSGERRVAFFLRGNDRVDFLKAKTATGMKLRIASPDEVRVAAGVDPGAVCPLLLNIPLILDTRITELPRVNFGSGHHLHGIEMMTEDFIRVVPHKMADVAL